jgi:hypothetical protein
MNLFRSVRAATAAAILAVAFLGANIAPTFADEANLQPTVTLFTSPYAYQDPANAFNSPGTPLMFWGVVQSTADGAVVQSGSVVMFDGNNQIAQAVVADGQFSITIPAYSAQSLGRGMHLLTVQYLGNDLFASSTSPVFTEVIQGQHY